MPSAAAKMKMAAVAPPAVVTIQSGVATPDPVTVDPQGTILFDNRDMTDYRLRLWTRKKSKHLDVDVLLPGAASVTLMVDPDVTKGDCEYELLPTNLKRPAAKTK